MKTKLLTFLSYIFLFSISASSQNLLENGSFENNFTQWTNLAGDGSVATYSIETSDVEEGTKAMKVEITTAGTNAWSVQSIHSAWPSVSGTEYRLRLYAKALVSGTSIRAVQQTNTYSSHDFALTTNWQQYEWVFTAQENDLQFKFHFFQVGTILIDNISIEPTTPVIVSNRDTLKINAGTKYQIMEGFGAAMAYYDAWLVAHPNKEELYQLVFQDLGLDWLRIQNIYRNEPNFQPTAIAEIIEKAHNYADDSIRILMTSWSPPANIKNNNSEDSGTLAKDGFNNYVYGAFGDYWKNSLTAYNNAGIFPNWISIQNEPDWEASYATCKFAPTETSTLAGYDKAFDSVYIKIKDLPKYPLMIGAEPTGIGNGNFGNYNNPIKSNTHLYGYAYHLYNGGDPDAPNSFNTALSDIAQNFSDRPNIMSEFEHYDSGWLKTGWLINNVLTQANASAYFYWDLMWPDKGLIDIDNPWDNSAWGNAKGYTVHPHFYALKHFSKHIKPGYQRISGVNANSNIISSAFINKQGGDTLVFVLVNSSTTDITTLIDIPGKTIKLSDIYQSSDTTYYQSLGSVNANNRILLPANSLTTVVMKVADCNTIPTVNAGSDKQNICGVLNIPLEGTISGTNPEGIWSSSGTGTFSPNNTTLNPSYVYSNADVNSGTVTLTLTSKGTGVCNINDDMSVNFQTCSGINKIQNLNGVKVYPVPASNTLNIDLTTRKDIIEVSLINSIGMKVNEFRTSGNEINIDLANVSPGLFILIFKTTDGQILKKEIIKN